MLTAGLLVLALAVPGPAPGAVPAVADRDCGDFADQASAQRFFIAAGGPGRDPHSLDSDEDGVACETRPCPCSTAGAGGGPAEPKPERIRARVLRAVDGDTIRVRAKRRPGRRSRRAGASAGSRVISVRLLGIDTPEKYGGRECMSSRASDFTNRLLKGRRVKLATDPTQDRRDRYGRLLAYVTRGSKSAQVSILRRGLAKVYAPDGPFRRINRFSRAQAQARQARRGAWSACGGDFHKPQ